MVKLGGHPQRPYQAKRLGEFVANTRRRQSLGLSDLAKRAGITPERLAEVETGVATLEDLELAHLAAALSLSKVVLLEEAGLITYVRTRRRGLQRSES